MRRAGFILAATLLLTPAWTIAQERSPVISDSAPAEINGEPLAHGGRVGSAPKASGRWAPRLRLPSITSNWDEKLSFHQKPLFGLVSQSDEQIEDYTQNPSSDGFGVEPAIEITPIVNDGQCQHCGDTNVGQGGTWVADGCWMCDSCGCDVQGRPSIGPTKAARLGVWGVESQGSPVKVGEFQDLTSSPFYDLDGIWSNGAKTFNYTFSGLDPEANNALANYYLGPGLSVDFYYQRFLHRLDHDPLSGFDVNTGTPGPTDKVVTDDLNVGEDYAIRVQQLDTRFQGLITDNLRWRVNVWGMRKSGERQANAMAHCFNLNPPPANANYTCHVLSQRQNIDWTTFEIKPALEAQIGEGVVEYSRTMRVFGQNDQVVQRTYTAFDFSPAFGVEGPPFDYALVPENFTQTDQVKLSVPVNEANQLYANLYVGNTENQFRETKRGYYGYDLRLTNRSFDNITTVAYAKLDAQNNTLPTNLYNAPPLGVNAGPPDSFEPGSLRHPVEYNNNRVGIKGSWRSPTRSWLSIVGGYEYFELARDFADYNTSLGTYTQADTRTNQIKFGPQMRVSPNLDTFVRYRGRFIDNPLIGVGPSDGRFNSNQPEQVHGVELGGTWNPSYNFMATALFGIENSWNDSQFANFDEDNYPILFTIWYAPSTRLSFTAGYAFLSNWIDQDITIGFQNNPTETTQWNYDGYNNLVSFSGNYAWRPCTQLIAGVEWNRGTNVFSVPPSTAGANWTALPSFSDIDVTTTRLNMGIDHEFQPSMNGYLRYVYFDYDDMADSFNNGSTNMFLAGFTMLR